MLLFLKFARALRTPGLALVLIAVGAGRAAADSVTMKDGRVLSGTIRSQNREVIVIQTGGGTLALDRRTVLRVTFGAQARESPAVKIRVERKPAPKTKNGPAPMPEPRSAILDSDPSSYADFLAAARLSANRPPIVPPEPERSPSEFPPVPEWQEPAPAEHEGAPIPEYGRDTNALWRSALFPGWGQWHQNRAGAGFAWAGLFTLSAFATADAYARYRDGFATYQAIFNPFAGDPAGVAMAVSGLFDVTRLGPTGYFAYQQSFRSRREAVSRRYATFLIASTGSALIYCANLLDAGIQAKSLASARGDAGGEGSGFFVFVDAEGSPGAGFSLTW